MGSILLRYEQRVQLLTALFSVLKPYPTKEQIEDILSCLSFDEVLGYMSDVGITYSQNKLSITLHQTTVSNDKQWIINKIEMLFKHLINKV